MTGMGDATSTGFDWRVYADATAAGMTALIPIPVVDVIFESTFRRRIPVGVSQARNRFIKTSDRIELGQLESQGLSLAGCLMLPVKLVRYILTKLWRKVVYVFAVTDATQQVSEYWHRAHLIDHMVRSGYLDEGADSKWAIEVFHRVLPELDPSPLLSLAKQVVTASHRVLLTLIRARREGTAATTAALGEILKDHWSAVEQPFRDASLVYDRLYAAGRLR